MARPLNTGLDAVHHDVVAISKAMRRIEGDPDHDSKEKAEMIAHLKAVLTWLLTGSAGGAKRAKATKK